MTRLQRQSGKDLFDRLAVVHRPDCAALAAMPANPLPVLPDEGEVARLLASDAAGRYGIEARQVYEDLRRVIGQLAGMLILARLTAQRDWGDLDEMKACQRRLSEARARIRTLAPVGPLVRHRHRLSESAELCEALVKGLLAWKPHAPDAEAEFDGLNARIKQATALLESCSSEKAGLQMVDFSQACCSCGNH